MFELLLIVFPTMLFIVAAMAVGVVMGRKPIAGSCGGMKALGMETQCEICGGEPTACREQQARPGATARPDFYNALEK